MTRPFLNVDVDGILLCPLCGESRYTHIDDVFVAGRPREDGEVVPVHIDSHGRTTSDNSVALPIPDVGRRHAISLGGWCESCGGRFAIEFLQHKGQTAVAVRKPTWVPVDI